MEYAWKVCTMHGSMQRRLRIVFIALYAVQWKHYSFLHGILSCSLGV